jgi:hypothetical protein
MRSFRLSGPSPAMVVACVALSLALAGSAVAGTDALNRAVTKSKVKQIAKKQGKKQANKQLRKNVSNSHVNLADNATNATNAANATNATNATNASFANAPFAYAHVTEARTVDASRSRGLTSANILVSATGIICWDIPFEFKTVQATQDSADGTVDAIVSIHAIRPGNIVGCPGGTDLATLSIDLGDTINDEDYDLWFGN